MNKECQHCKAHKWDKESFFVHLVTSPSLVPPDELRTLTDPDNLQIYFLGDPDQEVRERSKHQSSLKEFILLTLQEMIHKEHPLVKSFKTALEQMTSDDMKVIIHADKTPAGQHERRFNAPTVDEVSLLGIRLNPGILFFAKGIQD